MPDGICVEALFQLKGRIESVNITDNFVHVYEYTCIFFKINKAFQVNIIIEHHLKVESVLTVVFFFLSLLAVKVNDPKWLL